MNVEVVRCTLARPEPRRLAMRITLIGLFIALYAAACTTSSPQGGEDILPEHPCPSGYISAKSGVPDAYLSCDSDSVNWAYLIWKRQEIFSITSSHEATGESRTLDTTCRVLFGPGLPLCQNCGHGLVGSGF